MGRSKGRLTSRNQATNSNSGLHSGVRTTAQKPTGLGHAVERIRLAAAPECVEPKALLDYLAIAASDLNREVLDPEQLPKFAHTIAPSIIVPPQRPKVVQDEWSPNFSAQPPSPVPATNRNFGLAESALQGLADMLTLEAGSVRDKASFEPEAQCARAPEFVQCAKPPVDLIPARSSSYEMLNSWLNTGRENSACATADDDDDTIAFSLDEIETVSLYATEEAEFGTSAVAKAIAQTREVNTYAHEARRFLSNMISTVQEAETADDLLSMPSIAVAEKIVRDESLTPVTQFLPAGRRLETLDNGAQIIKDSLGRVIEVRSPLGPVLRTRYDENGHLRFFVRTDKDGKIQSYGESDKQGVVVHDPEGRVRAAGESMAIDRVGRLSIVRKDGQFWSIDLARGLHVERRQMVDEDGQWTAITAVFAYDGFRMVTRFQSMDLREFDESEGCYPPSAGAVVQEEIRLYGRDGSCVQFNSEEAIEDLRPSRVWPPASRAVDKKYRNRWQAGTAWQAVREYLELLKSGSG
jgi:YD repeat-containing protein